MSLISVRRSSSTCCDDSRLTDDCLPSGPNSPASSSDDSECYFTVKGAAVVLDHSQQPFKRTRSSDTVFLDELESHLHEMMRLLRPQDRLTLVVQLQSTLVAHTRYLALITASTKPPTRESALVGIDFYQQKPTIGVTLPVLTSTQVELDGDGGILVSLSASFYLFKPVSIQAMWLVFQHLHRELQVMERSPNLERPEEWLSFYQDRAVTTQNPLQSSMWYVSFVDDAARGDLCASRASTSSSLGESRSVTEEKIQHALRQIMQTVDLDEVTSRDIRKRLNKQYKIAVDEYKDFVDREMLVILGQMEKPSKIFDYLYLGTEWNASNWDELHKNGVKNILNMTREVDNFFPLDFRYLKIFVSDEANTELLMHWHRTYDFIKTAKDNKEVVLVHCKKGISRSSSTVIAYIMKEYGWSLKQALDYVKAKRNCITPNSGFMDQLQTFGGILNASRNRKSAVFNGCSPTRSASDVASSTKPKKVRSRESRSICEGYLKAIIGHDNRNRTNKPKSTQESKSSPLSDIAKKFGILSLKVRSDGSRRASKPIQSHPEVRPSYVQSVVGVFEAGLDGRALTS